MSGTRGGGGSNLTRNSPSRASHSHRTVWLPPMLESFKRAKVVQPSGLHTSTCHRRHATASPCLNASISQSFRPDRSTGAVTLRHRDPQGILCPPASSTNITPNIPVVMVVPTSSRFHISSTSLI
eukprot:3754752-Rhodomonas_salina.1